MTAKDALRDKIARAIYDEFPTCRDYGPAYEWDEEGNNRERVYGAADAVLAVLDLDKVRAEAFGQGIRSAIDAVNKTGGHAPLVKAYLRKAEQ